MPNDLSTEPNPVQVTARLNDLANTIIPNKEIMKIIIPNPILLIKSDSMYSLTHGWSLGTKIIVIISEIIHFKKDKRLRKNPFRKHCIIQYIVIVIKIISNTLKKILRLSKINCTGNLSFA